MKNKINQDQRGWVRQTFDSLTVEQKIGQLVCERDHALLRQPDLAKWLKKYPVGSVFVGAEIIQADLDSTAKIRDSVTAVNAASQTPVLFCGDFEHGVGSEVSGLTRLPDLMALGATGCARLAREYGAVIAREGLSLGVRWTFSPVVDLNTNINSWVVNQRAIGDEPGRAVKQLKALVAGMQAAGMAACIKHFPGDGTDDRNQHVVTSLQMLPFKEWEKTHGRVFQELIDAGALSVMIGHIGFPALEGPDKKTGRYRPATASKKLMSDLLRRKMGFKGIIVTDALTMCGFCSWAPYEQRILECFNGGADVFLWPDTPRFFELMRRALKDGRASLKRLDESARRILEFKALLGLHAAPAMEPLPAKLRTQHQTFARTVAERSLTLLRNRRQLLPLKLRRGARALVMVAQNKPSDLGRFAPLCAEFKKRGVKVTLASADDFPNYRDELDKFAVVLLAGNIGTLNAGGTINLVGKAGGILWPLMARGESKLIGVSFGNPYFLREIASIDTYVNAYSNCDESQRAVVAALFGETPFPGRSPVSCPFVFRAGEGGGRTTG